MSHVESAERKNGSGCANDVGEKSIAGVESGNTIDERRIQVEPKASQVSNGAPSPESDGNLEIHSDKKTQDDEVCASSGDICRICHMGRYAPVMDRYSSQDLQVQNDQTTTPNLVYLGPLISACKCRGTVALVHVECLERWLTESGRARCELCGYRYATKRVLRHNLFRSVLMWFHTVIATRQVLLDIGYLAMSTPVAAFSCYVCTIALNTLLRNGFYEVPWVMFAMMPTCLLSLIAYWRWIITLGRLHGHRWRRYWRSSFVIRLIPDNGDDNEAIDRRSIDHFDPEEDIEWRIEEIEEFA